MPDTSEGPPKAQHRKDLTMSVDRSTLEAKPREASGKGVARKLRAQGLIPAVVYGKHLEKPAHIAIDPLAIRKAVATPHKLNTLITLKLPGAADRQVLLKDYQQDPVTRDILHADFIDVKENEKVKVNVPVVLVGKAIGVTEGGILSQNRRELEVWALAKAIPEKIEVDVTNLRVAQALHINDIKMPEGVEVKTNVNYTLAVVTVPEKEEEKAVVAAPVAVAGAPVAGAPAAGADAKAADGKAAPAKAEGKKDEKKK
jgi:large subunit ribosomal protein L25